MPTGHHTNEWNMAFPCAELWTGLLCWSNLWLVNKLVMKSCQTCAIKCNKILLKLNSFWTKQNNLGWTYVVDPMERPIPIQVLPWLNGELGILFFPVFSWDHKINHFTFCVWMDIGYVQHAFTQGVFKKVEMCQIAKKIRDMNPYRAKQTSHNFSSQASNVIKLA